MGMKRPGTALLLSVVLASAGCGLIPGGDPKTREPGPTSTATAEEDPPPEVTVTGYLDRDALIEFDGDGDGAPEQMYQLAEYTTAQGLTAEEWVDVEASEEGVDGRLWFVLENETEERVAEAAVEFEIPKTLLAEVDAGSFVLEGAPTDAVQVTVIDPDPRFEVRVVDFAGGLRPTIRTEIDPELIALGARAIFGGVSQADIEAYAVGRTVDTATHVINMTARDFAFLRKARECEAVPEGDWSERQLCAAEMVLEFPDKFTEQECADIAAIHPASLFSAAGCRAAVANDAAACAAAPVPGNCLRWVEKAATNRCAILAGYPGARERCTDGIGPWLAGYCEGSDWGESCCETLTRLGYECDGGASPTAGPVQSTGPALSTGTYPVEGWFTSSLSACEAVGVAVPSRALEDHDTFGGETDLYGTDYADSLFNQGFSCLFRDPDEWYHITEIVVSCWPTEADAHFVWNGDYGGGSIDQQYCGPEPGVAAEWAVDCAGEDRITIAEGCSSVGDSTWCAGSVQYRDQNCSVRIQHHTGPSTDPVEAATGFEETISRYLDSLR